MARSGKGQGLGRLEAALRELEQVVERLETGEMPLEQALKEFEQGVRLTRECQAALKEAEQKVEILLKKSATATPEPFAPENTGDEI